MSLTKIIIFLVGLSALMIGWAIFGVELWHLYYKEHVFELAPMTFAAVMITGGAITIQTGDVRQTVKFLKSVKSGGRRSYDPPKDA